MAEDRKRRRRRRWVPPVLAIGAGAWFVRSRRASRPDPWVPVVADGESRTAAARAVLDTSTSTPAPAAPLKQAPVAVTPEPEAVTEAPKHAAATPEAATMDVPDTDEHKHEAPPAANGAVSTSGALTSGVPNTLFTPTAPTPGQGAQPMPDGSAPGPEYTIKGNADSMLFHPPTSPYYRRTKAEVWFRNAEDARAAGYTEWAPKKRSTS